MGQSAAAAADDDLNASPIVFFACLTCFLADARPDLTRHTCPHNTHAQASHGGQDLNEGGERQGRHHQRGDPNDDEAARYQRGTRQQYDRQQQAQGGLDRGGGGGTEQGGRSR